MARRNKALEPLVIEMNMTPIIDVTFNLLIFFMCQIRFKTLEGKIESYLPTERGSVATARMEELLEDVSIRLSVTDGVTVVSVNGRAVGTLTVPRPGPDGRLAIDEAPPKLPALEAMVKRLREEQPAISAVLEPDRDVPNGHVVAVVDACLAAGQKKIQFATAATAASPK